MADKEHVMRQQLELVVDAVGYHGALQLLSEIAILKADHIRANWQDHNLAKEHEKVANLLAVQSVVVKKIVPA